MSISFTGIGEALGVKFDSPQTLRRFLILVLETKDPYQEHYVSILKNGGILPVKSRAFQSMLKRKGITASSIPNVMRGDFLVAFQGSHLQPPTDRSNEMNIAWTNPLDKENQGLLIRNLQIRCRRDEYTGNKRFVSEVCLPILQALHQGEGETEGSLQLAQASETADSSRAMIETTLNELYCDFITPLDTAEAAKYLGYSRSYARRVLGSIQGLDGDTVKIDNVWQVSMAALDDWLLKHGKVSL